MILRHFFMRLALLSNLLAATLPSAAEYVPEIYGTRIETANNSGFCSFKAAQQPDLKMLKQDIRFRAKGGGTYHEGRYYVSYYNAMMLVIPFYYEFDMETPDYDLMVNEMCKLEDSTTGLSVIPTDMTWDPVTNEIYGFYFDSELTSLYFARLDRNDHQAHKIATKAADVNIMAIAANNSGELFGMSSEGDLYKVDKSTGKLTSIGSSGVTPDAQVQSLTFDPNTGKLYWTACSSDGDDGYISALYEVNYESGLASKITEFPDGAVLNSIYIEDVVADSAPGKAENLAMNLSGASDNCVISFIAPTTTHAGTPIAQGQTLTYHLEVGETCLTGTAAPGATVSVPATVAEGQLRVSVRFDNEVGKGERTVLRAFAGYDKPLPVTNVQLKVENNEVRLSWDAPTGGANGGYIDSDNMLYEVKDLSKGAVVADALENTLFTTTLPEGALTNLYYQITPYYGDFRGDPTNSEKMLVGDAVELPFAEDFETDLNFDLFTVVDGNNDNNGWKYYDQMKSAAFFSFSSRPDGDWLITPPLKMSASDQLKISFNGFSSINGYIEKMRVAIGTKNSAEAMTTEIVPVTEFDSNTKQNVTAFFTVPADGTYYIGFEAKTDAEGWTAFILGLDDIEISVNASLSAPAAVSDLNITPAEEGALAATIAFTAPQQNLKGDKLSAIDKIEIYRNSVPVHTFDATAPGAQLNFTDENAVQGFNTYTILPYNQFGPGQITETSVFVGIDVPTAVSNVKIVETETPGEVTISWTAPESTGVNGGYVDVAALRYAIRGNGTFLATDEATATEYTDNSVILNGGQQNIFYSVAAISAAGESEASKSNNLVVGIPYALPFIESFADGAKHFIWDDYSMGAKASWSIGRDNYYDVNSYDDDNGLIRFSSYSTTEESYTLKSGKISLSNTSAPTLKFFVFRDGEGVDFETRVSTDGSNSFLLENAQRTDEGNGWESYSYSMADYIENGYFYLHIKGIATDSQSALYVDAIQVYDNVNIDLQVTSVLAPAEAVVGAHNTIKTTVTNVGSQECTEYSLQLYADDTLVLSEEFDGIESHGNTVHILNFIQPDASKLTVKVVSAEDANPSNNAVEKNIVLTESLFPAVTEVHAILTPGVVELEWTAPDLSDVNNGKAVTESFETFIPFTISQLGSWTTIDNDGYSTYSLSETRYDNDNAPKAFQILVPEAIGLDERYYAPYSGSQMIIAVASSAGQSDDYLVSPKLPGREQTISFYARSPYLAYGAETFRIMYSTTGNRTSDFKMVPDAQYTTTDEWTCYTAVLPEGTTYFAINYISFNTMALLVDDVVYEPAEKVTLLGYDIFRDGKRLNDKIVTTEWFTDNTDTSSAHIYSVVALYDKGESEAEVLSTEPTGLDNITVDSSEIRYFNLQGIEVKNPEHGVYIRCQGGKAEKVVL